MTTTTTELRHVGVLGLGTMGAGIAQVLAASGRDVTVLEQDGARIAAGRARLEASLDRDVARGRTTEAERAAVLERVWCTSSLVDLAPVDLVVESVSEDLAVKRAVLDRVAATVAPDVPIVTNTSALSVTELATGLPGPERFAGLHFFNPAPAMRTVEVVPGLRTTPELVERLVALVESLADKIAVVVKDRPGFLVNSLLLPYLNDVVQELDDDLATAEDIDVALQLGLGYRTGPLAMLDLIGLDVHLQATTALHAATADPRYAPPPLLRQMVADGRLGDKSGDGFRTHPSPAASPRPVSPHDRSPA